MSATREDASAGIRAPHYVPASMMLAAVETDPQFQLPRRPVFIPGTLVVPMAHGLVVEGGPERQVFRGKAATQLLPDLIPLLDGTRTVEEAAAVVGRVRPVAIRAAVALLYTAGLLHDGPDEAPLVPGHVPSSVATYVARSLDSTRARRSPGEVFAGLAAHPLSIVDTGKPAGAIADLLRRSGERPELVGPDHRPRAGETVLMVCEEHEDTAALSALDQRCAGVGATWLRVFRSGSTLEVGPRFEAQSTACYDCFVAGRGEMPPAPPSGDGTCHDETWTALVATEVFNQRTRVGTSVAQSGWAVTNLDRWRTEIFVLSRRPGCERCLPHTIASAPPLPYIYEQATAFPPRHLMDPKGHQNHYKLGNILIQHEHLTYASAEQIPLPRYDLDQLPTGSGVCDLEALSAVLLASYGLKPEPHDEQVRRYPATGGNLGSPQGFVLVRDVRGLEAGAYYYEPFTHRLSVLATAGDGLDVEAAARSAGVELRSAAAGIVTVSALTRVAKKYAALALRICLLDAGVARSYALAVADELGVTGRVEEAWDGPGLISLLNLGDDGLVTSVLTISGAEQA
ncbi:hypothetical protein ACZ90_67195 [Streptomyces albus subsp. albus]|nr:hypothetical protein ACZ90_67195 [Streptomyces albus subsp. albus]